MKQEEFDKMPAKPKFKVGDWAIDKYVTDCVFQITKILDNSYEITEKDGHVTSCLQCDIDDNSRLWTIKDAKVGDVLANDHHILILKELDYDWYSNGYPYSVHAYCGIKPNGNFELGKDNWCFCGTLHMRPATSEERDLLFDKMKEAGYEWDADKKELKKINENI